MSCSTLPKQNIPVLFKTVSEACNLACDYCYYSKSENKKKINTLDLDILEKFIIEYAAYTNGNMTMIWQGGEPLLAGLPFFEKVMELQNKYASNGSFINNSLQTNATLITEEWARFFKKHNFLLGISLDGPKEIHDKRRVNLNGNGSFDQVMRGIHYLDVAEVDYNILTVVHEDNVGKERELMEFYLQEGFQFLQFIPGMDFTSQDTNSPGEFLISPKEYGQFLCNVFDVWFNNGNPLVSVRFFDNMASIMLNLGAELCTQMNACPKMLILESNGDAFPCDFFINEEFKLGNIGTDHLNDIISSPLYDKFLTKKADLPIKCRKCEYLTLCYGGCPRNRNWAEDTNYDYFCYSYKMFYQYAYERMKIITQTIRSNWIQQLITK